MVHQTYTSSQLIMIDNLHLIRPLLEFHHPEDFYMLYVFKRKKDQPPGERSNHQSVRTIKSYCIRSLAHLEEHYEEIRQLCEHFQARAYIHTQSQNHRDVSLNMMVALAERIRNGQTNQQYLFDSVVGSVKTGEKRWVVDIDTRDEIAVHRAAHIIDTIRPEGPKIQAVIPTPNGYHFITKRFDTEAFRKSLSEYGAVPDIQKRNPTLLYYPDSLDSVNENC